MIALLVVAAVAVPLGVAGPLWRRHQARHSVERHADALQTLGRMTQEARHAGRASAPERGEAGVSTPGASPGPGAAGEVVHLVGSEPAPESGTTGASRLATPAYQWVPPPPPPPPRAAEPTPGSPAAPLGPEGPRPVLVFDDYRPPPDTVPTGPPLADLPNRPERVTTAAARDGADAALSAVAAVAGALVTACRSTAAVARRAARELGRRARAGDGRRTGQGAAPARERLAQTSANLQRAGRQTFIYSVRTTREHPRATRAFGVVAAATLVAVVVAVATTGSGGAHRVLSSGAQRSTPAGSPVSNRPSPAGSGASTSTPSVTPSPATSPRPGSSSTPARSPRRSTPTRATGDRPVISALSRTTGVAGQTIELNGANFFSADGAITVTFGKSTAPVVCPTQTTCLVTVPARASPTGSPATPVTVTTEGGTSTPMVFTYR